MRDFQRDHFVFDMSSFGGPGPPQGGIHLMSNPALTLQVIVRLPEKNQIDDTSYLSRQVMLLPYFNTATQLLPNEILGSS